MELSKEDLAARIKEEEGLRETPQPPLVKKGSDYAKEVAAFREKFGNESAKIVERLFKRHRMVDPFDSSYKQPYAMVWEEQWIVEKPSRDLYGEMKTKELIEEIRKLNAARATKGEAPLRFEDPHFLADASSLFADPADSGKNEGAKQVPVLPARPHTPTVKTQPPNPQSQPPTLNPAT